jgi:outer membrane biosynthesis protein TonB
MNTIRITIFCIFGCLCVSQLLAQSSQFDSASSARPLIGWDSLQKSIVYPEIARRSHFGGLYYVTVQVDTNGNVSAIQDESLAAIFRPSVESAIRSTKWLPSVRNGYRLSASVRIPMYYLLDEGNPPIIIRAIPPPGPGNVIAK